MSWDPRQLPSAAGRTFVVTGGNAGIGYFTAEQLASAGARVILASRSADRAKRAIESISEHVVGADLSFVALDLSSLSSVARAADALRSLGPIDDVINNAGLVSPPARRATTADGHELIVGTNFFGHFALTAQLWPAISPAGRVVGLGSMSTRMVRLDPSDLLSERRYRPFRAYGFSKHAVHGFAFELDRRIRAAGEHRLSLLAHPGFAIDGLSERRAGVNEISRPARLRDGVLSLAAQGKHQGAWPTVRAALDPDAVSGQFFGPSRPLTGPPVVMAPVVSSATPEFGAHLWALAEERTGVIFAV
ncbi:MAG TPA: SDR family NAD(P)-dependent oxidoreductase [Pseudolysinimonas sp.]|nr:SDR family NAD(P)-dependent oxidoreductase [Pseudolysinimonas sp.]